MSKQNQVLNDSFINPQTKKGANKLMLMGVFIISFGLVVPTLMTLISGASLN